MVSPIPAVYKSLIRSVTDFVADLNTNGSFGQVEYHDWEERGLEKDLPAHTLVGLDGFSFDENEGLWVIRVALAVSSYNDVNLLNEIELIGLLHERFGQKKKVNLLRLSDGALQSELVVTDFRMLPMAQSEVRNYRTFSLELHRTGA